MPFMPKPEILSSVTILFLKSLPHFSSLELTPHKSPARPDPESRGEHGTFGSASEEHTTQAAWHPAAVEILCLGNKKKKKSDFFVFNNFGTTS